MVLKILKKQDLNMIKILDNLANFLLHEVFIHKAIEAGHGPQGSIQDLELRQRPMNVSNS